MLIQNLVIIIWSVGILLSVALLTLLERKLLGSLQRRLGPDTVGYVGLLQPIADALKLLTKQNSNTINSSSGLFYLAPMWALVITLLGWGLISRLFTSNYNTILTLIDNTLIDYSWLALLAILSLTIYSVLLLGWSANSSYSLVGSLRSSCALVSYELILATSALLPMVLSDSYNLLEVLYSQNIISFLIPLLPVSIILMISVLAETSRVPFDLIEAESELVSGYMTEHASIPFVLLFLTEYASILLYSTIMSILFIGPISYLEWALYINVFLTIIILMRAVLPRIRYDQLILFSWMQLLPLIFTIAIIVPSLRIIYL